MVTHPIKAEEEVLMLVSCGDRKGHAIGVGLWRRTRHVVRNAQGKRKPVNT